MKRVALLGCGAIGTRLALAIDAGHIPARLERIYDARTDAAEALASRLKSRPAITENPHLLSYPPIDIVVEAASQDAVRDTGLSVIQNRADLMVMSVGALLDPTIREVLEEACAQFGGAIYLPSGAVGGLDALAAVRGEIDHISITTAKHPRALRGAPHFAESGTSPDSITRRTVLFEGDAGEAVRRFPANVNVAALVSMAAGRNAKVTIAADPDAVTNTHTINAAGAFGAIRFTLENLPDPDNPKTSRLAALSAVETLRRYCSGGIRIGT